MELSLKENEEKFKDIFNSANDSIYILHLNGRIQEINDVGCDLLGYTKQELLLKNVTDINSKEDIEGASERLNEVIKNGSGIFETAWITKDGKRIPIELNSRLIKYAGKTAILSVGRDISERKKNNIALIENETRLRTYMDNAPEGIFIVDATGNYLDVNKTACSMLGYSREELLSLNLVELSEKNLVQESVNKFHELKEKGSMTMETILLRKDGTGVPIFLNAVALPDQRFMAFCTDISERKRIECELKINYVKYKTLLYSLPVGVTIADDSGKILESNNEAERILGLFKEEQGKRQIDGDDWRILRPDGSPMPADEYASVRALKEKTRISDIEMGIQKGDGSTTWISVTAAPIPMEGQGVIIIFSDITKRKQTDDELKNSEARYYQLFDNIGVGVAVYVATEDGTDFIFKDFNQGAQIIDKVPKEEVIGRKVTEVFPGIDEMGLLDVFRRVHQTGKPESYPLSLYQDDKIIGYTENYVYRLPSNEVVAVFQDFTAIKEMENRIKNLASFPALSPNPVLEFMIGTGITYANASAYQTVRDIGRGDDVSLLLPKDIEEIIKTLKNSDAMRTVREVEVGGRVFQASILNVSGTDLVRVYETEITQSRLIEDSLLVSERRFKDLFDVMKSGVAIYYVRNDGESGSDYIIRDFNKRALEIEGKCRDEVVGHSLLELRPTIDSYGLIPIFRQVWKTGEPAFFPSKIYSDERYSNWYENTVFRLPNGEIVAIYDDATDRMLESEKLKKSESLYRLLADNSTDVIGIVDTNGSYTYVSPSVFQLRGYSQEEVLHQTIDQILTKESILIIQKGIQQNLDMVKQGIIPPPLVLEVEQLCKDGSTVWVEAITNELFDATGKHIGANVVCRDIAKRKRVEEALLEVNRKLNLLSSITRHDIRSQLMALEGNLDMLQSRHSELGSDDHLRKAEFAAKRISAMINFTKEYENVGVNAPIWQDAHKLVKNASKNVQLGKISLVNDIPTGTELFADPLILKVFNNLIDNAIRHGGAITKLRFSLIEKEGTRVIVCEDDGVGISPKMKGKLFTQSAGKEHGFGLFLSREILAITGITIEELGEPGKGAKFVLLVPEGGIRRT